MDGLLLIDKPLGITSFDIIRNLRRTTGFKKIGHAGTLDPLASGLMLMLFGQACKKAQLLSGNDKRYIARITLGSTSTTGDNEGEKIYVSDLVPKLDDVNQALIQLTGDVVQTPSPYSAIKINGQEAYKRVRAGEYVEMPSRNVKIYEHKLLNYAYPELTTEVMVSSGTYIRTLAEDLGKLLECGAYLDGLIRTEVGDYKLADAVKLDDVTSVTIAEKYIRSI